MINTGFSAGLLLDVSEDLEYYSTTVWGDGQAFRYESLTDGLLGLLPYLLNVCQSVMILLFVCGPF